MSRHKEPLLTFLAVVATLAAVTAVGLRLAEMFRPDPSSPHRIAHAEKYATEGHLIGPPDAPVRIVEFADYQCPYCRQMQQVLDELRRRYPDQVSVIFRHYPLMIHDSSVAAARAAECASSLGGFLALHRTLFEFADSIGHRPWHWFAATAGIVDLDSFDHCLLQRGGMPQIDRDRSAGEELGIVATPTFLVNDLEVVGAAPIPDMDKYVRNALKRAGRAR